MGLSVIYVKDAESEINRKILCFAENEFGFTPASVPIHHVLSFPASRTITIAQSGVAGLSTEHNCYSESLINGVLAVYVDNAAPPEYIDFFFKIRDDYSSMKDMVFPIGRCTMLDPVYNNGSYRVYSSIMFSLPHFAAVGMTIAPFASIGAKLPAAWAPATALEINVDILGLPGIMAP